MVAVIEDLHRNFFTYIYSVPFVIVSPLLSPNSFFFLEAIENVQLIQTPVLDVCDSHTSLSTRDHPHRFVGFCRQEQFILQGAP